MEEKKRNFHYDHMLNIAFLGSDRVGKTSLIHCIDDDGGYFYPSPTLDLNYSVKYFDLDQTPAKRIKAFVYDTPGGKNISEFMRSYKKGNLWNTQLVYLVYDITDEQSFKEIPRLYAATQLMNPDVARTCVLIGNKCESICDREVTKERGQALADEYGIPFFEVSTRLRLGVKEAFNRGMSDLLQRTYHQPTPPPVQAPPPPPLQAPPARKWWKTLLLVISSPIWILPYLFYRLILLIIKRREQPQPQPVIQPPPQAINLPQQQTNVQQQLIEAQTQARAAILRAQQAEIKASTAATQVLWEQQQIRDLKQKMQQFSEIKPTRQTTPPPQKDPLQVIAEQLPAVKKASEKDKKAVKDKIGETEVPDWALCPISQEIMTDPVIVQGSGQTYDRVSISSHFVEYHKKNDPITGLMLTGDDFTLKPNISTRDAIEDWVATHTKEADPQASPSIT